MSLSTAARQKDEIAKQPRGGQYGSPGLGDGPGKLESGNLKRLRAYDFVTGISKHRVPRISFETWSLVRHAAPCSSQDVQRWMLRRRQVFLNNVGIGAADGSTGSELEFGD